MKQKGEIAFLVIPVLVFLSITMNELKLWHSINFQNIRAVIEILVAALELLAILLCVRLYRSFNNPFFKFQGIALAVEVVNTGLSELRLIIGRQQLYNHENDLYQIASAFIIVIISLSGILLALYAILTYREGWAQEENTPLVQRFNDLLPSARNNRLFWPVIIGVPLLLLNLPLVLSSIPFSATVLFNSLFSTAGLVAKLLGLLLCLALVRAGENHFFKYMVAIYIIPLGVTLFAHLNGIFGLFLYEIRETSPSNLYMLSTITLNYIVLFHDVVITGLLVAALLTYRELSKDRL
ncbi:MAG: hypothetical protein A4E55_01502 [Pelotomaculum sp. PtaU1.Bin035]|nr:MAG: hypothetical protein A4E55_01502 [Pelotomaculum sp. PtaU1.Bin035]